MTVKLAMVSLLALLVVGGCRDEGRSPVRSGVPDVVGLSLEDAKEVLDGAGVEYDVEAPDGQTPLIDHFWEVCDQDPDPGFDAWYVELDVDREC
jgi:hypothetical protein